MDDGIHTLSDGDKDNTTKVQSIWESRELFLVSYDDANRKGLQPLHPVDLNMIQPREPKKSVCQSRSKIAHDKAKNRIWEGMTGEKQASINDENDESSDEEATSKHKTPLQPCHLPATLTHLTAPMTP